MVKKKEKKYLRLQNKMHVKITEYRNGPSTIFELGLAPVLARASRL